MFRHLCGSHGQCGIAMGMLSLVSWWWQEEQENTVWGWLMPLLKTRKDCHPTPCSWACSRISADLGVQPVLEAREGQNTSVFLYFGQKLPASSEATMGSSGWRDRGNLEVWKFFSPGFYPWVTAICGQSRAQHLPVTVASCVCTCFHHSSAVLTHVQAIIRS